MLHLYVLSGGDRLINFVQWFVSAASIIAVSYAASQFGANARGQALADLFCATIPSGILVSSGAKNDSVLAAWVIIAVCFALRFSAAKSTMDAMYLGAAIGMALFTKATAYLYLPWLIAAVWIARRVPVSRPVAVRAAAALACARHQRAAICAESRSQRLRPGLRLGAWQRCVPVAKRPVRMEADRAQSRAARFGATRRPERTLEPPGVRRRNRDPPQPRNRPNDPATTWEDGRSIPRRTAITKRTRRTGRDWQSWF